MTTTGENWVTLDRCPHRHPYDLFLQLEDIEHRTTKVKRPQSYAIVELFHRTLFDDHFRVEGRARTREGA